MHQQTTTKRKLEISLFLALLITCIALLSITHCSSKKLKTAKATLQVLGDTLQLERNEKGQLKASISVFEFDNERQLRKLQTQDSTINKLKQIAKNYRGKLVSATVLSTETVESKTSATTLLSDSSGTFTLLRPKKALIAQNSPIYVTEWANRWSIGRIEANPDSIYRNIRTINEFRITHGFGKYRLFRKRSLTVNVLNLNPNTVTRELRSYVIKVPQRRFGLSVYAGYGLTATTTGNLYHGFQIGFGASWRFFP